MSSWFFGARRGLGRIRPLAPSFLWMQEIKAKRGIEFQKVSGDQNVADLVTKLLVQAKMQAYFQELKLSKDGKRPEAAPQLVRRKAE